MLFSTNLFLFIFLPVVLFGYYVLFRKNRRVQNIFLMLASLIFYAWGEPLFVSVMILSIIVNWFMGKLVVADRGLANRKRWLIIAIVFNLGLLFVFKYLSFVSGILVDITGNDSFLVSIALPIGISFFTFQAMSYVIDVYRGKGEAQHSLINVGLYISFFPQLIAGPIVRYQTIANQISHRKESYSLFSSGVVRFVVGLSKKVLLANNLALIADKAFVDPAANSVAFAWLGALAYTLQIYYDFSGYSDMAIGLGRMFGFEFRENFDYPYYAKSISEFWRRWHISLGNWFRDYVYFPLGGSRVSSKRRLLLNLFVVWFLTGIWHGANWTFIVWGLFYFVLVAFEKGTKLDRTERLNWFRHIYTMFFVVLGWVLFKSDSLSVAWVYLKSMFSLNENVVLDNYAVFYTKENVICLLIAIICSLPAIHLLVSKLSKQKTIGDSILFASLGIMFILAVCYMVRGSYNPFIYFNF